MINEYDMFFTPVMNSLNVTKNAENQHYSI